MLSCTGGGGGGSHHVDKWEISCVRFLVRQCSQPLYHGDTSCSLVGGIAMLHGVGAGGPELLCAELSSEV